ncbi:STAS domain-containing protein [Clostridiaceae bacterium HSG29]|nr:STAS domain-containing protein [Clostridiaceae bacterium HSG29]
MRKNIENNLMTFIIESDLIAPNVKKMKVVLNEALNEVGEIDEVVIDLNGIENIDSVGVSFVVGLYKNISNEGLEFRIINASSDIVQLFKLMRLDEFFIIEE